MNKLDKPSKESKALINNSNWANSMNKAHSSPNIDSEVPKFIQNQILKTPSHEKRAIEFCAPKKDKNNITKKYTLHDLDTVKKKISFDEIDFTSSIATREEIKSEKH